jgi:hypothetical protein
MNYAFRKALEAARREVEIDRARRGYVTRTPFDNAAAFADFRGEYDVARYAAAEQSAFQMDMPNAIRDRLGEMVNGAFTAAFNSYKSTNPSFTGRSYLDIPHNDAVQLAQTIRQTPVSTPGIAGAFSPLENLRTYGDVIDTLYMGYGGGFVDRAQRMAFGPGGTQDFNEIYQTSYYGLAEATARFDPEGKSSFSRFGGQNSFYAVRDYLNNDKHHGASRKISAEGMIGDELGFEDNTEVGISTFDPLSGTVTGGAAVLDPTDFENAAINPGLKAVKAILQTGRDAADVYASLGRPVLARDRNLPSSEEVADYWELHNAGRQASARAAQSALAGSRFLGSIPSSGMPAHDAKGVFDRHDPIRRAQLGTPRPITHGPSHAGSGLPTAPDEPDMSYLSGQIPGPAVHTIISSSANLGAQMYHDLRQPAPERMTLGQKITRALRGMMAYEDQEKAAYSIESEDRPGFAAPSYIDPSSAGAAAGIAPGTQFPQLGVLSSHAQGLLADWLENSQALYITDAQGNRRLIQGQGRLRNAEYIPQTSGENEPKLGFPSTYVGDVGRTNMDDFDAMVDAAGRWKGLTSARMNREGSPEFLPAARFNPYDNPADDQRGEEWVGRQIVGGGRAVTEGSSSLTVGSDAVMTIRNVNDRRFEPTDALGEEALSGLQDAIYHNIESSIPVVEGSGTALVRGGDAAGYARQKLIRDPKTGEVTKVIPNQTTDWMTDRQNYASDRTFYTIGLAEGRHKSNVTRIASAVENGQISYMNLFKPFISGKDTEGFRRDVNELAEAWNIPIKYEAGKEREFVEAYKSLAAEQRAVIGSIFPTQGEQMRAAETIARHLGAPEMDIDAIAAQKTRDKMRDNLIAKARRENTPAPGPMIDAGAPRRAVDQIPHLVTNLGMGYRTGYQGFADMIAQRFGDQQHEMGGLIIGRHNANGDMQITDFRAASVRGSRDQLNFTDVINEVQRTLQPGEEILGTIHTQPGAGTSPSQIDLHGNGQPGHVGLFGSLGPLDMIWDPTQKHAQLFTMESGQPQALAHGYANQFGQFSWQAGAPARSQNPNTPPASHGPLQLDAATMANYVRDPQRLIEAGSFVYGNYGQYTNPQTGQTEMGYGINGRMTVTGERVQQAQNIAADVMADAIAGGPLPSNDADALATVISRTRSGLREKIKQAEGQMQAGGMDETTSKEVGNSLKEIGGQLLRVATRNLSNFIGGSLGNHFNYQDVNEVASNAIRVASPERGAQLEVERPGLAQAVRQQAGLSLSEAAGLASGSEVIATDPDTGIPYSFGQIDSGAPNRSRNQFGFLGTRWGRGFYGAYMLKRLYNMGLGPEMQKAAEYGQFLQGAGTFGLYGTGTDISTTQAGYNARVEAGNRYLGEGAFEEFGGFSEIPYMLSGMGGGASRIISSATTAGTLALGGYMAGGTMAMMGMEGAVASALGPIGAVAGGIVLAGTLGMEIANGFRSPDQEPITWGNMVRGVGTQAARNKGIYAYLKAHPEAASKLSRQPVPPSIAGSPGGIPSPLASPGGNLAAYGTTDQVWNELIRMDKEGVLAGMNTADQTYALYNYNPDINKAADLAQIMTDQGFEAGSSDAAIAMMSRARGGMPSNAEVAALTNQAISLAMTPYQLTSASWGYAQSVGQVPGMAGFASTQKFYEQMPASAQSRLDYQAARLRSLSGQVEGFYGMNDLGVAQQQLQGYGVQTSLQASTATSFMQAYATYMGPASAATNGTLMYNSQRNNAYVGGVIANAMNFGGMVGANPLDISNALSGAGMTNQQAYMLDAMLGGDIGAFSYQAWQTPGMDQWKLYDQAGRDINQVNGSVAMNTLRGWIPEMAARGLNTMGLSANMSDQELASRMGIAERYQNSYLNGYNTFYGTQAVQAQHLDESYNYQMAGIGVQYQGIALQQAYLWGNGSWASPAPGSSWNLEDQMRQMQYGQQMWQFGFQGRQMELQNQFAISRENLSYQQMGLSQGYQNWTLGFNYNQQLMQRGWTQQDWQYQDTTRNLNFEWHMQDYAYNIRYATGRQRQQLVRERDRAALSFSLEGEQIDKTRERQQEQWALEDERYQKEKNYTLDLQSLDKQSWQLSRDQRIASYNMDKEQLDKHIADAKREYELQTQIIEQQRKFQNDQIELQKQSLGVQAAAAKAQHDYEETMMKNNDEWGKLTGMIGEINKYEPAFRVISALTGFTRILYDMDVAKPDAISRFTANVNNVSVDKINKLLQLIAQLSNMPREWN